MCEVRIRYSKGLYFENQWIFDRANHKDIRNNNC